MSLSKAQTLALLAKKASAASVQSVSDAVATKADSSAVKTVAPSYYYVIVVGGQSESFYGEGQAFPNSFDAEHPRIKQLARRTNTKRSDVTGNAPCAFNDIIPLDWCPHNVEDQSLANRSHDAAFAADARQYGAVAFAQSMAKRLLPMIPDDAGILIVPESRGGSAFTLGTDRAYDATTGAPASSTRWGVTGGLAGNGNKTALYLDMRDRTKAALDKNPRNILWAVCWSQGEFDQGGTPANHKALFEAMVNDYRTELNSTHRKQCLGLNATKVPWLCMDTVKKYQETAGFATVFEGTYRDTSLSNLHYIRVGKDEQGNWTQSNAVLEDPDIVVSGTTIYYGSASRGPSNLLAAGRDSHFGSWALRGIIAERMASAVVQTTARLLPGLTPPEAGGAPRSYVQGVTLSGATLTVKSRNDITGAEVSTPLAIPMPAVSVINYAPTVLSVGYNGRRGNGTLLQQGFTGSLEYAANTAAISGATVIDGAAANNPNTLTSAITHPDGLGGFTYRHEAGGVSLEWYKKVAVNVSELADLIRYGGYANFRAKIYSAFATQYLGGLIAIVNDANPLLPAGTLTGVLGTDNDKLAFMSHYIQLKTNSIYWSAWQDPTNTDLVSIPFDNNYHDYRLTFAGGNVASVVASIDGSASAARGLHYSAATNTAYIQNGLNDTTAFLAITDITNSDTADFYMDSLQFVIYRDNGNIMLQTVDANHAVTLQKYNRSHTITIPDAVYAPGKSIEITAQNTGNVVVQGANSNVLIQPLGGSVALPSSVTIARASGDAQATYKFTQVAADGKTWVRTA